MIQPDTLQAQIRTEPLSHIRKRKAIPAVVYGHGMDSKSIVVDAKAFVKTLKNAGLTSIVTVNLDGEALPVLIREVQYHPVQEHVLHVDFYRVRMDEAIRAKVPLVFVGVAPAVKDLAGVLVKNMDELEVEALPKDLPSEIEVDISSLVNFETSLHVKDVKVPNGVTMHEDAETVIALVQPPRSEQELESLAEEVKEDVEAVEGVTKPEVPAEGEEDTEDAAKSEKKEKK